MLYVKLLVLLVYEASFHGPISVGLCRQIQLKQNGYEGIIVGIDRNIPQASSSLILTSLKVLISYFLLQSS